MTSFDNFSALSLDEKHNVIRSRRLCFCCLRYGHSNRDCQRRLRCSKCDRQHPTLLHDDRKQQSNFQVAPLMPPIQSDRLPRSYFEASAPVQFQSTNRGVGSSRPPPPQQQGPKTATSNKVNTTQVPVSQHISAMIVPVYLSHKSCPDQKKLVYAMLDSQSDTSFITDQTLDSFNAPTEETVLNLATMNACMPVICRKIDGFKVQGHGCQETVNLPTLYSRPEFPNDRSHIPSANICYKFDHLKSVATKLLPLQNVEVGLLLGYDTSYVHQPQEVISSKVVSDPYAIRTPLGWCVIGSTESVSNTKLTFCNRILCSERTSVVFNSEATEVAPKDFIRVFEQDFNDTREEQPLSREDKAFLAAMAYRKQLSDGHYEIPMPCKESVIRLEGNISMAEQRLGYLKRKMERSSDYKLEYTAFMNDMIENNFCERVVRPRIARTPTHSTGNRARRKTPPR